MHEFTKRMREKGYDIDSAADAFGVQRRVMFNICRRPNAIHWMALRGLPDLTAPESDGVSTEALREVATELLRLAEEG